MNLHGAHGSHSSHGNTDSHTNSVSSVTLNSSNANAHTATIGGVDWSGTFNNSVKIGVYGSSGSLSKLTSIVNNMRARPTSTTYTDNTSLSSAVSGTIPSSNTAITSSAVNNLIKHGGSSYNARYQPYTLTLNTTASVTSNGTAVADKTTNTGTGVTKTQSITGSLNTTTKSWTNSATGVAGTTKSFTYTDNLAGVAIVGARNAIPSFSATSGTIITKSQANAILAQLQNNTLQKYAGPASKSFSWTGDNTIAHSNHGSHSSSSKKFKVNIEPLNFNALDLIKNVEIKQFNYNNLIDEDPSIKHIGFIAEDTPEEFSTHYHDRMDYTNCIGILLKAIQELDSKLCKLMHEKE